MSQLGERLRQARENLGISLAQAAVETRILHQSLIALEEGAFQRLPGDVVTRGFIRNYAQYLGLPAEEMIELYRRERGASDQIRIVPATHPPPRQSYVLPSFLGVFFVTIALVGLAYVALNALGRFSDENNGIAGAPAISATAPATPTSLPVLTSTPRPEAVVAGGTPEPAPAPTEVTPEPTDSIAGTSATPEPTATPIAPIVVEINIPDGEEASWLRIRADGVVVFEGTMRNGDRQVFPANREFYIRAGNPPAVQITVNGQPQGPMGLVRGQPVDWNWPPQ